MMDLPWRSPGQLVPFFVGGINGVELSADGNMADSDVAQLKGYMFAQMKQLPELEWVYSGFPNGAFYGYTRGGASSDACPTDICWVEKVKSGEERSNELKRRFYGISITGYS